MEKNIVYHGSNVEVSIPRILQNGFYKDFGYGFYCTSFEKQAKRWAMTRKGASVVNHYEYTPNTELKILTFNEMTDEWLDLWQTADVELNMIMTSWKDLWQTIRFGTLWKDSLMAESQEMHSGDW